MMVMFRYEFGPDVGFPDIEIAFVLAIWSTEDLYGQAETRLQASHAMSEEKKTAVLDASTELGRDLNRLFVGNLIRMFGPDAFNVRQIESDQPME